MFFQRDAIVKNSENKTQPRNRLVGTVAISHAIARKLLFEHIDSELLKYVAARLIIK